MSLQLFSDRLVFLLILVLVLVLFLGRAISRVFGLGFEFDKSPEAVGRPDGLLNLLEQELIPAAPDGAEISFYGQRQHSPG